MSEAGSREIDFASFVSMLAASAIGTLAQVDTLSTSDDATDADAGAEGDAEEKEVAPEERNQRVDYGLAATRQIIETLVMLERKTEGNLTADEMELLQSVLTELRVGYARTAERAASAGQGGGGESAS